MKLDIGIDLARPHPGACVYPCAEVVNQRREWTCRQSQQQRHLTSVALAMATSSTEAKAKYVLDHLIEHVAPQMEFGNQALSAFTSDMTITAMGTIADAAVAWTDGRQVRLVFCGKQRTVLLCQGHAKRLPPPEEHHPRWFEVLMEPGDWFIMAVPATDTALPLGSILQMANQGMDAMAVCRAATAQAAQADPFNHHAVLAMHRLPA